MDSKLLNGRISCIMTVHEKKLLHSRVKFLFNVVFTFVK